MLIRPVFFFVMLPVLAFGACDTEDDHRNKFTGRYEVEEYSHESMSYNEDYEVLIRIDHRAENQVIIENLWNFDSDIQAVAEEDALTVFPQDHGYYTFEGQGTLSGSLIEMHYTVTSAGEDPDFIEELTAEMKRIE